MQRLNDHRVAQPMDVREWANAVLSCAYPAGQTGDVRLGPVTVPDDPPPPAGEPSPLDAAVAVVRRQLPGIDWIEARKVAMDIVIDPWPGYRSPWEVEVIAAFNQAFERLRMVE